ncbi:MAG: HEPN domain-containing protein [Pseudomonadota bacterium]
MSKDLKKMAEEWFDRAASDLKYARAGEKETGEHHVTCFLCHQAVEKTLKGLIVLADKVPQKTHHLGLLTGVAAADYPAIYGIVKDIRRLDKFYAPSRYPGGFAPEFKSEDAELAISTASHVLDIALAELEQ